MSLMRTGAKQLAEWIRKRGDKKAEVAELFGISAGYLSMFLSGERCPGRDVAVRIQDLSGIPVGAWSLSADNEREMATVSSGNKPKRNKA